MLLNLQGTTQVMEIVGMKHLPCYRHHKNFYHNLKFEYNDKTTISNKDLFLTKMQWNPHFKVRPKQMVFQSFVSANSVQQTQDSIRPSCSPQLSVIAKADDQPKRGGSSGGNRSGGRGGDRRGGGNRDRR